MPSIKFNSHELSKLGSSNFTISSISDPPPPAIASRIIQTIEVEIDIATLSASGQKIRYNELRKYLDVEEGELTITDENGGTESWLAKPSRESLAQPFKPGINTIKISFRTQILKKTDGLTGVSGSYKGIGKNELPLHNIENWNESVQTGYSDDRNGNRELTTNTITFEARTSYANPSLSQSDRLNFLHSKKQELEDNQAKEGQLKWGGFDQSVQITNIRFSISEGYEYLSVQTQARYSKLPDNSTAEAKFNVSTKLDGTTNSTRTTVSGTVNASDRAIAVTKVNSIHQTYQSATNRTLNKDINDEYSDGADGNTWLGLNFSIELDEGDQTDAGFTLEIDNSEDPSGNKKTYTGKTRAQTLAVALAKARLLGKDKHPVMVSEQERISYAHKLSDHSPFFVEVNFNYSYSAPSDKVSGTITCTTSKPAFGDYTTTLNGTLTGPDQATLETRARSYIPTGKCLRENTENINKQINQDATNATTLNSQVTQISFNYGWSEIHTETSIQMDESITNNFQEMIAQHSISGNIFGADKATCIATLNNIKNLHPTAKIITDQSQFSNEGCGNQTSGLKFLRMNFNFSFEENIAGTIGCDLIEASWSLDRRGQVENKPVTQMPCADPIMQAGFGFTQGSLTATGSVKARLHATARSWGQSKRTHILTQNGETGAEQQPQERMQPNYRKFNGSTAQTYTFSFTYSAIYAKNLKGIWPTSLTIT